MNKMHVLISCLFIQTSLFSQIKTNLHTFECNENIASIVLPTDFIGPKYFHYEQGSIINFFTPDTCVVSFLCGYNAELTLDSTYHPIDSIVLGKGKARITYFSKALNRYARKNYLNEYLIMYDRANLIRKEELDIIFDSLEIN
jgi:hypothetical protein